MRNYGPAGADEPGAGGGGVHGGGRDLEAAEVEDWRKRQRKQCIHCTRQCCLVLQGIIHKGPLQKFWCFVDTLSLCFIMGRSASAKFSQPQYLTYYVCY